MDYVDLLIQSLDSLLNTGRKRHVIGGLLLSLSAMFSGLAITVLTVKND